MLEKITRVILLSLALIVLVGILVAYGMDLIGVLILISLVALGWLFYKRKLAGSVVTVELPGEEE